MARMGFPRERGAGRSPQVGPGTFDARTVPAPNNGSSVAAPQRFECVVWSPGPGIPSTELWCTHAVVDVLRFEKISAVVGESTSLFLNQVPSAEEFVPPQGAVPDSPATVAALRAYSRGRYIQYATTALANWRAHVATPAPTATALPNRKIDSGLYRVAQRDRPTGMVPLAWVDVFDGGRQELWAIWRPNEPDGFHIVGTQPVGSAEIYAATELRFTSLTVPAELPEAANAISISERVIELKSFAANDNTAYPSPVYDESFLEIHHFRVRAVTA